MKKLVKIIPPAAEPGLPCKTQGTRILLEDGSELHGVAKVELTADPNDIWRAVITCYLGAAEFHGVHATIHRRRLKSRLQERRKIMRGVRCP
jgi:hypothetical protein